MTGLKGCMEPLGQGGDGHRITRKKVNINGEDLEIISGDTSKLDPCKRIPHQRYRPYCHKIYNYGEYKRAEIVKT